MLLSAFLVSTLGLVACSGDDDDDPTKPKEEKVLDVGVDASGNGQCLLVGDDVGAKLETLPVIACDQPHTHEVYDEIEYFDPARPTEPVDVYPGLAALADFATTECAATFDEYVGINPFDSKYAFDFILPTLDGWNDEGDKIVLCVITDPTQAMLKASVRGTAQ